MKRREFIRNTCIAGGALALPAALHADAETSPRQLPTRPIPASGDPLPILGLGNSTAFRTNDIAQSEVLLSAFLGYGGGFVDTGGTSQEPLGRFMQQRNAHDQFFLGTNVTAQDATAGRESIIESQRIQGKKVLDLLQIPNLSELDTQWRNLRDWKEAGLTRYIGVAIVQKDWYGLVEQLIDSGTIDFVQINYSILEQESGERILPLARDKGVAIIVNRPFINGRYFKLVRDKPLPEWAADFDCNSWAQFSLKFILAHPAVNCVLTETANPKHLHDNLSAGFGRLPDEASRMRMVRHLQSL